MEEGRQQRIETSYRRGRRVTLRFDGTDIIAFEGETIAAALIASGIFATRLSPAGHARGPFCFMGSCQECAVRVDGRKVLACATPVAEGLAATTEGPTR